MITSQRCNSRTFKDIRVFMVVMMIQRLARGEGVALCSNWSYCS